MWPFTPGAEVINTLLQSGLWKRFTGKNISTWLEDVIKLISKCYLKKVQDFLAFLAFFLSRSSLLSLFHFVSL